MNENELIERLNSVQQYSLEDTNKFGYGSDNQLVEQGEWGGEWIRVADVAKVLGLTIEHGQDYGKFQS
jgi:hypothetical protein